MKFGQSACTFCMSQGFQCCQYRRYIDIMFERISQQTAPERGTSGCDVQLKENVRLPVYKFKLLEEYSCAHILENFW